VRDKKGRPERREAWIRTFLVIGLFSFGNDSLESARSSRMGLAFTFRFDAIRDGTFAGGFMDESSGCTGRGFLLFDLAAFLAGG